MRPETFYGAIHEASHLIRALQMGYQFAWVTMNACQSDKSLGGRSLSGLDKAYFAAAGLAGEIAFGNPDAAASHEDRQLFFEGLREAGHDYQNPRVCQAHLDRVVLDCRIDTPLIQAAAYKLILNKRITPALFARLCREPGSRLAVFADRFPLPVKPKPRRPALRSGRRRHVAGYVAAVRTCPIPAIQW